MRRVLIIDKMLVANNANDGPCHAVLALVLGANIGPPRQIGKGDNADQAPQ